MGLRLVHRFDGGRCAVAYWGPTAQHATIAMGLDPQQLEAHQPLSASPGAEMALTKQPQAPSNGAYPQQAEINPAQACSAEARSAQASPGSSISLEAEVPELLYEGMRQFISNHPQWDQYRLVTSALANFLFQNGCSDQTVTQHYLNGLFLKP